MVNNNAALVINSEDLGIVRVLLLADIRHLETLIVSDLSKMKRSVLDDLAKFARDLGQAIRSLGRDHPLVCRLGTLIAVVQKQVS